MDRGTIGSLNYQMTFPSQQQMAQEQQGIVPMNPQGYLPPAEKDPLAVREKLTSDYYNNYNLLQNVVKDAMAQGLNPFEPDYSQEGGGLAFQTFQRAQAGLMYAANALKNEMEAETQMRPYVAMDKVRISQNANRDGLYASDPNSYYSTESTPGVDQANRSMGQETNDPYSQNRANQLLDFEIQKIDQQIQSGAISPERGEFLKAQLVPNTWRTQMYAPRGDYYGSGYGDASGLAAYVKKMAELANGGGFEAGKRFDSAGNRIDVARPAEFVGRQLGFTPDGKKFVIDRFEKTPLPTGGFQVEAVDTEGNRTPVDPRNITGSLRNFIETNEGAGALKDFNRFMMSEGFNTALQDVAAQTYAQQVGSKEQTEVAPKVQKVRTDLKNSLGYLTEGGIGRFLRNAAARGLNMPGLGDFRPTELSFTTEDGKDITISKTGEKFKFKNYQDFFNVTPKGGQVNINGENYNVKEEFENLDQDDVLSWLEDYGVVGIRLKDSSGKEVDVPQSNLTPEQQKAQDLINKYRK